MAWALILAFVLGFAAREIWRDYAAPIVSRIRWPRSLCFGWRGDGLIAVFIGRVDFRRGPVVLEIGVLPTASARLDGMQSTPCVWKWSWMLRAPPLRARTGPRTNWRAYYGPHYAGLRSDAALIRARIAEQGAPAPAWADAAWARLKRLAQGLHSRFVRSFAGHWVRDRWMSGHVWRRRGQACGVSLALLPTPSVGTGPLFAARTMAGAYFSLGLSDGRFFFECSSQAGEIAARLAAIGARIHAETATRARAA